MHFPLDRGWRPCHNQTDRCIHANASTWIFPDQYSAERALPHVRQDPQCRHPIHSFRPPQAVLWLQIDLCKKSQDSQVI